MTIKIVSETSPEEIARKRREADRSRAISTVRWALIDLAANILRVTRGAGKSYELGLQAQKFVEALVAYHGAVGEYPDAFSLDALLSLESADELSSNLSNDHLRERYAKHSVVKGALQIAASRLLQQRTIELHGEKELHKGIRELEDARQERRLRYAQEHQPKPPSKRPKAKNKTKPKIIL